MMRRTHIFGIALTLLFTGVQSSQAQNLVPNADFENFFKNTHEKGVDVLRLWYIPTRTSTDYFNKKSKHLKNEHEEIEAHSGTGYTGIVAFDKRATYREYMSIKLSEKLQQYHVYRVSYFVQLSTQSTHATNAIGAAITMNNPLDEHKHDALGYKPQIQHQKAISNSGTWIPMTMEFVANGGEQFLTIGNFNTEDLKGAVKLKDGKPMAYYYFDDVSVEFTGEIRKPKPQKLRAVSIEPEPVEEVKEEIVVLENIYFQSGNSILEASSYPELKQLAEKLRGRTNARMEIYGHTDNVGDPEYNLKLSEQRAKAVVDYLISQGISARRLSYKGFGDKKPKYSNDSEKGRRMNRRVEFKVIGG